MNKYVIIISLVINLLGVGGALWCSISSVNRMKKEFAVQQEKISEVISKLPPAISLEAHLQVEDKSKFTLNGKGNSGTINVPQEKMYYLEFKMDSVSMIVKDE